jgi:PPOX class probable F420-dependent enzyme
VAELAPWALELVTTARVGHLATAGADAEPHVVPVCFVLLGQSLYSVIDEKPKSGRRLLRLRNIAATGRAALVVDRYDEDWARLAYVLARGRARVIGPDDPAHASALAALRAKYPQYRAMALEAAEMVELAPERWTAWRGDGKPAAGNEDH